MVWAERRVILRLAIRLIIFLRVSGRAELTHNGVIDGIADSSLGHLEIDALFSGLAFVTKARYLRGCQQWCIFCDPRKIPHWIDTTKDDWDGDLLDFIIYAPPSTPLGTVDYQRKTERDPICPHCEWEGGF